MANSGQQSGRRRRPAAQAAPQADPKLGVFGRWVRDRVGPLLAPAVAAQMGGQAPQAHATPSAAPRVQAAASAGPQGQPATGGGQTPQQSQQWPGGASFNGNYTWTPQQQGPQQRPSPSQQQAQAQPQAGPQPQQGPQQQRVPMQSFLGKEIPILLRPNTPDDAHKTLDALDAAVSGAGEITAQVFMETEDLFRRILARYGSNTAILNKANDLIEAWLQSPKRNCAQSVDYNDSTTIEFDLGTTTLALDACDRFLLEIQTDNEVVASEEQAWRNVYRQIVKKHGQSNPAINQLVIRIHKEIEDKSWVRQTEIDAVVTFLEAASESELRDKFNKVSALGDLAFVKPQILDQLGLKDFSDQFTRKVFKEAVDKYVVEHGDPNIQQQAQANTLESNDSSEQRQPEFGPDEREHYIGWTNFLPEIGIQHSDNSPYAEAVRELLKEHPETDFALLKAFIQNPHNPKLTPALLKEFADARDTIYKQLDESKTKRDGGATPQDRRRGAFDVEACHLALSELDKKIKDTTKGQPKIDTRPESQEKLLACIHMYYKTYNALFDNTRAQPVELDYIGSVEKARNSLREKEEVQLDSQSKGWFWQAFKPDLESVFGELKNEKKSGLSDSLVTLPMLKDLIRYGEDESLPIDSWIYTLKGEESVQWNTAALVEGHLSNMATAGRMAGLKNSSSKRAILILKKLRRARDDRNLEEAKKEPNGIDAFNKFFKLDNISNQRAGQAKKSLVDSFTRKKSLWGLAKLAAIGGVAVGTGALGLAITGGQAPASVLAALGLAGSAFAGSQSVEAMDEETTVKMDKWRSRLMWTALFGAGTLATLTGFAPAIGAGYTALGSAIGGGVGLGLGQSKSIRSFIAESSVFVTAGGSSKWKWVHEWANPEGSTPHGQTAAA